MVSDGRIGGVDNLVFLGKLGSTLIYCGSHSWGSCRCPAASSVVSGCIITTKSTCMSVFPLGPRATWRWGPGLSYLCCLNSQHVWHTVGLKMQWLGRTTNISSGQDDVREEEVKGVRLAAFLPRCPFPVVGKTPTDTTFTETHNGCGGSWRTVRKDLTEGRAWGLPKT